MNSLLLIKGLLEQENGSEFEKSYLSSTWNRIWNDGSELCYAHLRLTKTIDKINNLIKLGIDFNNKKVLDIGCGNGATLLYLRKKFNITGTGVDISSKTINDLNINIHDQGLQFILGDHRNLAGIDNDDYDIVLSFGVIEHFEEYCLALTESRRVLKPGGILILIQPHLLSFGVLQELWLRIIRKWRFGKQKNFTYAYYKKLLKKTGFREVTWMTKAPYKDMRITRIFDIILKRLLDCWGHYVYLIAKK